MWHQGTMLRLMDMLRLHVFIALFNQGMVFLLSAVKLEKVDWEGRCWLLPCFLSHLYIHSVITSPSYVCSWRGLCLSDPAICASALAISPQVEHLSRSTIVPPQHCLAAAGE